MGRRRHVFVIFNVHYKGQTLCKDSHLNVTSDSGVEGNEERIFAEETPEPCDGSG